jgi:undecaprenyl pyrophosphate synthase
MDQDDQAWAKTNPDLFAFMKTKVEKDLKNGVPFKECFKKLTPKIHLGIIPDGNRRWCKKNGKTLDNYAKMIEEIMFGLYNSHQDERDVVYDSFFMIGELSVYVLSKDNLKKRDDGTLKFIEMALDIVCSLMRIDSINTRVKLDFIGDVSALPVVMQRQIELCQRLSRGWFPIHLAVGYDPIEDSKALLKAGMESRTPIDMVLRSGGEKRASGFFPLQTLYSEWVYYDELWPEMTAMKFNQSLLEFTRRKRNFGK